MEFAQRLAQWGWQHKIRAILCIWIAVWIVGLSIVGIAQGRGCRQVHNKKFFESTEPFYTDLAWGRSEVSWCWAHGRITDYSQKIDADITLAGYWSNWSVKDKDKGQWYEHDHEKLVTWAKYRFTQNLGEIYHDSGVKNIGIVVHAGGTSSLDPTNASGGGGGGSW